MTEVSSHKPDKRAKYRSSWGAVDYVHAYNIDIEKKEIYLFGREEYIHGQGVSEGGMQEPGVDYVMANQFIKNLRMMQSVTDEPILIHMKTCGGDWSEGMAIYSAIKACPNHVTILNYTHARSMSSLIFLAADKRVMMPYSVFMAHKGSLGVSGTATQVYTEIEQAKIADRQMMDIYVEALRECEQHKGKSDAKIRQWLLGKMKDKEEVYFSAKEAVDLNFADFVFGADGTYDWSKLRT